jgi:protoporphyrinogen oxidase
MMNDGPLEVVIVGAGVAGLSAAYGLRHSHSRKINVKVFEKRSCPSSFLLSVSISK